MNKTSIYILLAFCLYAFFACQQRMICPAYTSSFILDNQARQKQFSLFGADSLPRDVWEVDKKKVGIADEPSYQKKLTEMRTIPMESVYKKLEDPFTAYSNQHPRTDSTSAVDTAAVVASYREENTYNVDELIYLYHFGKYFPKPKIVEGDVKQDLETEEKPLIQEEDQTNTEQGKTGKKWWPFGKGKKKEKNKDKKIEEQENADQ